MTEQASFENSPGGCSTLQYSEESMMDKGHVNDQPNGGAPNSSSLKHIVNAMPCVVNVGVITEISDDDGNLDMMHGRVEYISSESDDDVVITGIVLPSNVERGRQRATRRQAKRSTSRRSGSNRREASITSGEGTVKVVKNFNKNKVKESTQAAATTEKSKAI